MSVDPSSIPQVRGQLPIAAMSDTYYRYVPVNPTFQPTSAAVDESVALLSDLLPAESIVARSTEVVEFVDAGGNWEGVACPMCGGDADEWWTDAMSEAAERQFESLEVQARCCGALVSLNDLDYGWPVAFGRFVIEVANPQSDGLSKHELEQLGSTLGCAVREIKAHL